MSFPRRTDIRVQADVLAVCMAVIYGVNLSTPGLLDRAGQIKGTDFANFYVLGSLALNGHDALLYDRAALANYALGLLPELIGTYYLPIYGPQVALFFAPFAAMPYASALILWVMISAAMYGVCCWMIWKACPHLRHEGSLLVILAAAAPAFFNLVAHGQNSAIALACVTATFYALKDQKQLLAGLAIGTLVFKPQLAIVFACVFLLTGEWRVVAGALIGAAVQLGLTWLYFGTDVMNAYVAWLLGVGDLTSLLWIKPYQMHSLLSFWRLMVPSTTLATALYAVCASVVVAASYWVWRTEAPLSLRYSFLLVATVLVSPHLYVYDLVILAPAFLLVADWTLGHPESRLAKPVQRALYFSYALPLAGAAAQFTRVQLSVIAMTALGGLIAWAATE